MRSNVIAKALGSERLHPGFAGGLRLLRARLPGLRGVRGCRAVLRITCDLAKGQVHQVLCAEKRGHRGRHRETEVSCRSISHAGHRR